MRSKLIVEKSVIQIGLERPVHFLHITDAHMDIIHSQGKADNTDLFIAATEHAKEKGLFVLCTGDSFKGISEDNIAFAKDVFSGKDAIFLPGNHDFCFCPNNLGLSDSSHQVKCAREWLLCYRQNLYFDSTIIGSVNFVSIQNIYYSITYGQIQLLQKEVAKGYPIVLCMHIPLFTSEKADDMLATWAKCAYMMTPPEKYYSQYCDTHLKQQLPSQETLDAVAYIANEPAIKAVIAGHIHENFDGFADCGKRQICTAPVKDGFVREIEIR